MFKVVLYEYGQEQDSVTVMDTENGINYLSACNLDTAQDAIDSLTMTINHGFLEMTGLIVRPFKTLVKVYDLKKDKLIFFGRMLSPDNNMDSNGAFTHTYVFEGALAFLMDTDQQYSFQFDKMPVDNLKLVISRHNNQIASEPYKRITVGTVDVPKNEIPNDQQYNEELKYFKTWDDKTTYDTVDADLKEKYGGHLVVEYQENQTILHYLKDPKNQKQTEIRIGKNLKSIQHKVDPMDVVTRLKPLGQSTETANGDEVKLTISEANNGSPYIDIPELIEVYGIQVGIVDFPESYTPTTLKEAGQKWIADQNKNIAKATISIDALDLALIDIDPDDFELYNYHLTTVEPLGIKEWLTIIGVSTDLMSPQNKSLTIGEKQLSQRRVQAQQAAQEKAILERQITHKTGKVQAEVDYHQKVITGEIGGVLTVTDANGNQPIKNGVTQFNLSGWRYYPPFKNPGVNQSPDSVFFDTKNTDPSVFDAYMIVPQQRYLQIVLSCYIDTPGATGLVEVINFKASETKFYQSATVSAVGVNNQEQITLTIDLQQISKDRLDFYLRMSSATPGATIYAREMFVGTLNA